MIHDGFLFRANRLCIPVGSVHLLLLQEAHGGRLIGHFGAKKIEEVMSTLLAKDEMRCRAVRGSVRHMSKSKVTVEPKWFVYASSHSFYSLG